jgi:hypothetical protein
MRHEEAIMRRYWILGLGVLLSFGLGCTGMQTATMESLVEVEPVRGKSPWALPDLSNSPVAECPFITGATPVVDAELADWGDPGWVVVDSAESYTGENWNGPEDASFRIAFAYDPLNLYIAAEATDDVLSQPYQGADIWKGDSFQMGFDPRLDRTRNRFAEDDTEIGWAVQPAAGAPAVWRWTAASGSRTGALDIPAAAATRGNVTTFELAVPLEDLGEMSPGLLDRCGVSFMYNDNDSTEGGEREGYLEWTPSLGGRKDPSTFGVLQLGFVPHGVFPRVTAQYQAMRTVAEQGNPFEFKMDLVAGKGADEGTLTVVYRKGEDVIPLTKRPVRLEIGHQAYEVFVDTSNMEEGKAELMLEFAAEGYLSANVWPVYVYGPIEWGK